MRALGYTLGLILLALAAEPVVLWLSHLELPAPAQRTPLPAALLAQARSTPASAIVPGQSLVYPVQRDARREIKILSHGELPRMPAHEDLERQWSYTLELEWLDGADRTLRRRQIVVRTRLTRYTWQGRTVTKAFYPYRSEIPTNAEVARIRFQDLPTAHRLRVRLLRLDPDLTAVAVRAYQREVLPEFKLAHEWGRLSPAYRARLAKGNVYGPEFLSERERLALVRRRWRPLGPVATPRDGARLLYLLDQLRLQRLEPPPPPVGLRADVNHRVVVPIPPGGGEVALHFQKGDRVAASGQAAIHWYPEESGERRQWNAVPLDRPWRMRLAGAGLLELAVAQTLYVRALWNGAEITPDPPRTPMYRPDGESLRFALHPGVDTAQILRVTCRLLRPVTGRFSPQRLRLHVEDAADRILSTIPLDCSTRPSLYDRPAGAWGETHEVSEPEAVYLRVPPAARTLVVEAGPGALVAVHTRPDGLRHLTRVPEDYFTDDPQGLRWWMWFPLRALDQRNWERQGRVLWIQAQPRPPQDDPLLVQGRYAWMSLEPVTPDVARYVLAPRESRLPVRASALETLFTPVPAGRAFEVRLSLDPRPPSLRPRLVYEQDPPRHQRVRVWVDGRLHWSGRISGRQGLVHLPALDPGIHRFRIEPEHPEGRWLLSHVADAPSYWVLRLAYRLEANTPLEFAHEKAPGEETLVAWLFLPDGEDARARLQVDILGAPTPPLVPLQGWTLRHRTFTLAPGASGPLPLIPAREEAVNGGRRFFLPLHGDLPAGRYRIRFRLDTPTRAYLTLGRIQAGEPTVLRVLRIPATEIPP